jgi:hypothetical protein
MEVSGTATSPSPWMNKLNDYYWLKANFATREDGLKDLPDERYLPLSLGPLWRQWISNNLQARFDMLEELLRAKITELEEENRPPPAGSNLPIPSGTVQQNNKIVARIQKLRAAADRYGHKPNHPLSGMPFGP